MILSVNNYDPEEDEGRKRPTYMTAKDWRLLLIVVVVATIFLIPVYGYLMDLRNTHVCRQNLHEIASAIGQYCEDNNDRFPPVYTTSDTGDEPKVYFADREIFSWVSLLSGYTSKPEVFRCPSAQEDEGVRNAPLKGNVPIISDYGMYGALSTAARGSVSSPQDEVLICDSSNEGANGTADPMPFKDAEGRPVSDGVVIGLDTTNFSISDTESAPAPLLLKALSKAKYATRVAAPDSAKGKFGPDTYTRHLDGINVLMSDLHLSHISGSAIVVQHAGRAGSIVGHWATQ